MNATVIMISQGAMVFGGSDLEFRCRISRTHSHFARSIGAVPSESASGRSAFDQRESRPRREGLGLSIRKCQIWSGEANSARKRIVRSLNDSEKKIMKKEHQKNGALRGPLILMVPASNLVAVMSLDWLDGANQAAVSAQTHGRNYLANSAENGEAFRGRCLLQQLPGSFSQQLIQVTLGFILASLLERNHSILRFGCIVSFWRPE
jgi:hypothetical protein